ncbi:hypothetical protein LOK49_LG15G01671 [Camellia lanceoleosa]|uniref:Uncharacterized protein n=1 Tax=Camellia lanceoleosa TaxID=1840588 RepID=A0ACC0F3K1_9ERIC|nr:hypothetical protein LOK49_LG15G01671 [Camellia lanceoleosa]
MSSSQPNGGQPNNMHDPYSDDDDDVMDYHMGEVGVENVHENEDGVPAVQQHNHVNMSSEQLLQMEQCKTIAAAKSAHLEIAKSKVNKVVHSNATRLHRVNAQDSVIGATKAMRLHRVNAQDFVTGATKANDKVGVNKVKSTPTSRRQNVHMQGSKRVKEVVHSQIVYDAEKSGESNSFPHKSPKILGRMNMVLTGQRFSIGKEDPEIAENRDTVVAPPRKSVVEPVD